ncbi:MAG: HisA/HisF-related TIM barrel protein, partial [Synergistaceae bacterium]
MTIFPAVDLFEGRVIRLTEGDFLRRSDYDMTPLDAAKSFLDAGCHHIHIVDLEGAKRGRPCHLNVLEEIASLGIFIQYGGGLRSVDSVREAVN